MHDRLRVTGILVQHFFRRFFDNDTVQLEGDTLTTVVRAVVAVAVPGLMYAFFLQTAYAYPGRALWSAVQDQYFFVMFSFVVMGAVAIFEWETLFPDRLDFLVLSPLSLKPVQMLAGKTAALIAFLALFLLSCNLCGTLLLSAIGGHFLRQLYAHWIATLMAGVFAALLFLGFGGFLLCVLPTAWFRIVSPLLRMVSIAALALLVIQYFRYGNDLQTILLHLHGTARWFPPFWFLGLYEKLLHESRAPSFAPGMARCAICGTVIVFATVVITYPAAWARMRRMAVEGAAQRRRQPPRWPTRILHRVLTRPGERAVFHFIGHTILRNNRYQIYLAMYGGTGLALAIACAVTFREHAGALQPALSQRGLHAAMPLLLFWVIAGLRNAFAFPLNLSAGWIFRITGVSLRDCASAARRWVFCYGLAATACITFALRWAGWNSRQLLVQVVLGLCLTILLTDAFLFQQRVPFNQPRLPGKTNFPLMLTLYVGVFPMFILGVIHLEIGLEKDLSRLLLLGVATGLIHAGLQWIHRVSGDSAEEAEGYEGDFQLLGLSALQ